MVSELHRGASSATQIEIYAAQSRDAWSFDLASWIAALAEAQRKLG
jgi:hypothetical protein